MNWECAIPGKKSVSIFYHFRFVKSAQSDAFVWTNLKQNEMESGTQNLKEFCLY